MKTAIKQDNQKTFQFLSAEDGFLGLKDGLGVTPEQAKAWVIPFGLEASVSYGGGTSEGPSAIIEASHQVELFDEVFWTEAFKNYGVATLEPLKPSKTVATALDELAAAVRFTLANGKFPMSLGGEHSMTPGAIRPFVENGEPLTILQFDAHADLRDGYEGEHYSHAAAMCRCLDHKNVRLVSVGIRNISAEEIPFLEANKDRITIFWAKDQGKKWTAEDVAKAVGPGPVYITFDIDGFDASMIPATGTPEPGGLFWWDTMEVLEAVSAKAKIVGADVVELAPQEGMHACDFLSAKLVYKMLSYAMGLKPKA
jgi:agmatinase